MPRQLSFVGMRVWGAITVTKPKWWRLRLPLNTSRGATASLESIGWRAQRSSELQSWPSSKPKRGRPVYWTQRRRLELVQAVEAALGDTVEAKLRHIQKQGGFLDHKVSTLRVQYVRAKRLQRG